MDMTDRVRNQLSKNKLIVETIDNIMKYEDFENFFTELYDIKSVCMILGGLLLNKNTLLKFDKIAFALMNEAISRSCRSYLRKIQMDNSEHIRQVLDIENDFDLEKITKKTNKLYFKKYTNCTPFAVCAVLGFINSYHQSVSPCVILRQFINKEISMNNFLVKYFKTTKGKETQIALYLNNMKYCKSNNRFLFDDPNKVIQDHIYEQKQFIENTKKITENKKNKKEMKYNKKLLQGQVYINYHTIPNIFLWYQINDMNLMRPPNDQLELLDNGLLKHHCCYPNCPYYLTNFSTKKDIENNTRNGLFQHLKYDIQYLNNYVPSLHKISIHYLSSKMSYELYENKINKHFENNEWFLNYRNKTILRELYDQYNKLHQKKLIYQV